MRVSNDLPSSFMPSAKQKKRSAKKKHSVKSFLPSIFLTLSKELFAKCFFSKLGKELLYRVFFY